MGNDYHPHTLRVATGRPWKDAIISVLNPGSSLRPWRTAGAVEPGDRVVALLDTDPVSIFGAIGTVGPDRDLNSAVTGSFEFTFSWLLELSSFNALTGMDVSPMPERIYRISNIAALQNISNTFARRQVVGLTGRTTLAAARILLQSEGQCTVCGGQLDLTEGDAHSPLEIHTVDTWPSASEAGQPVREDWPAVLCSRCRATMRRHHLRSVVELAFWRHPQCPRCGGRRSCAAPFGLPAGPIEEPWIAMMGCVISEPRPDWKCAECDFRW